MKKLLKVSGSVVAVAAAVLAAVGSANDLGRGDVVAAGKAVVGLVTSILAAGAWWQARRTARETEEAASRAAEMVTIWVASKPVLTMRRSSVQRAEVLGRLGMIPMRPIIDAAGKASMPRFELTYLSSPGFLKQLDETPAGRNDVFIPATAAEFGRFDWEKFDKLTTEVPEGPSAAQ